MALNKRGNKSRVNLFQNGHLKIFFPGQIVLYTFMRIRNKEHQSLGVRELQQLCEDYPNDMALGRYVRSLAGVYCIHCKQLQIDCQCNWRDGTIWA